MAKRILIVDDTAFMRKMLADSLVQNGYAIAGEASNGREAIRLYAELRPDLVVMDINMPEMGGIEAVRELIKADPAAIILVCTAASQQEQIHEAMREGAKGYILKPFKMTRVLELIGKHANALAEREQEQERGQEPTGLVTGAVMAEVNHAGTMIAATSETTAAGGVVAGVITAPDSLEGSGSNVERVDSQKSEGRSILFDDQRRSTRPVGEQDSTQAASRETRKENTDRLARSEKVTPLRRRERMHSFVSSVMCHWQEERDGEPAAYTVVCTESENKVLVELSESGQTKQTMQFSLDGLLQLSNWLEDHLDRTGAGRGKGSSQQQ